MRTPVALEISGLVKTYGGRRVVDDVSFQAEAGTITTVLGPNGAGKTTTIECCEGLRSPDAGHITVLGLDRFKDQDKLRTKVGVMLQDGGLPMAPRAGDLLHHVARLHRQPRDVGELTEVLDLQGHLATKVRHLSGGQRQRLSLACALVGQPELVFLDEPSAGLDPASRRHMHHLLKELVNAGTTIILTTHLLEEAHILSDKVIVMHSGKIAASGRAEDLVGEPAIWVRGLDVPQLRSLVEHTPWQIVDRGQEIELCPPQGATPRDLEWFAGLIADQDISHVSIALRPRSLEDLYFDVVAQA